MPAVGQRGGGRALPLVFYQQPLKLETSPLLLHPLPVGRTCNSCGEAQLQADLLLTDKLNFLLRRVGLEQVRALL